MNHRIDGVIAQTLRLEMAGDETAWASKGSIVALDDGVDWRLKLPGGVGGAMRRGLSGEGMALTFLECSRDGAAVLLGGSHPGKIERWDLSGDGPVVATRGSFLAGIGDVQIDVTIARRAGAALFGGAGLFLQKMSGKGQVFVHASGDFVERSLTDGESMRVSTGNLAAFSATMDYTIRGVGGCKKVFFGGEGLFMTELKGPGRVLLQSLKRETSHGRHGAGG